MFHGLFNCSSYLASGNVRIVMSSKLGRDRDGSGLGLENAIRIAKI
jgi:hypothetical protein